MKVLRCANIAALLFFILLTSYSYAEKNSKEKPSVLNCESYPYLWDSGFGVFFDEKIALDGYPYPYPLPSGGWKFVISFDLYDEQGQNMMESIKRVTFRNIDKGIKIQIGPENAWVSELYQCIEFFVFLGGTSEITGTWELTTKMKKGKKNLFASWEFTEEMLSLERAKPATNIIITKVDGGYTVTTDAVMNGIPNTGYKFRVFDDDSIDFVVNMGDNLAHYDEDTNTLTWFVSQEDYEKCKGNEARIETRVFHENPALPNFCGGTWQMNRACKYFVFE
ncbi:MAG: hypothetical protein D3926_00360 [Desulfobacteraceae bacterium]|nr:MAG: hypothetical protein D3926_00360 [Desulfobacteraceae bacterium]